MRHGDDPVVPRLVSEAFAGPLDIVGDVHGEIDALEHLLRVLGYTGRGDHAQGRRLVFIGDLCDRGPDSPAVIQRVAEMLAEGTAQCLLGNHELNVLRGARKEANGWFFENDHDRQAGKFLDSRGTADDAERARILRFIAGLPLALERPDLRLAHACWDDARVDELRSHAGEANAAELYRVFAQRSDERSQATGQHEEVAALLRQYGPALRDPSVTPPLLTALAERDVDYQMSNPLRVLTSGIETPARAPFFLAGKWRMVERADWWESYVANVPVIFGHYWRWATAGAGEHFSAHAKNPFPAYAADAWLGPAGTAYCVDFCVGARFAERRLWPGEPFRSRLGAVRWPDRVVMFDDGSGAELRTADPGEFRSAR